MSSETTYYRIRGFLRWANWTNLPTALVGIGAVTYAWVITVAMFTDGPESKWKNFQSTMSLLSFQDSLSSILSIIGLYLVFGVWPLFLFNLSRSVRLCLSEAGVEYAFLGVTLKASWENIQLKHSFLGQHWLTLKSPTLTSSKRSLLFSISERIRVRMYGQENVHLNQFTIRWKDSELRHAIKNYLQ